MNLLDGTEGGREGVLALVDRARDLAAGAAPLARPRKRVVAVFLASSLRTRTSLESACALLDARPIILQPGKDAWALELRPGAVMDGLAAEHVDDALPVLAQYADVLAVRAFAGLTDPAEDREDPWLKAFVRHARGRPVISLESARFHPLQGLADTATWVSRLGPDLRGRRLTLTWAPHPKALPQAVPNQVLLSAALQGMDITLAHPEGFELDPEVTQRVAHLAAAQGGRLQVAHDPDQGVRGAEVVVAKAWSGWSGYADRAEEARRRAQLSAWRLTAERMAKAAPGAGFMHCLPVRRNVVVDDAVIDGPQSWVQEEAGFRLWTKVALLERTLQET